MTEIHSIDVVIIVVYLLGILSFGLYFKRFVKSQNDYFLAGNMLPWWIIAMSIIGTNIGAYDYIGAAGGAYRFGIAQANYEWIGAIPAIIISAFLFIPYYKKARVYTIPEFIGRRYNQACRTIVALLWGFFLICLLGIFFWAAGIMLQTYLGWNLKVSIVITAVIVGLYTVTGGLAAVTMTDVVQLAVMFVGGIAIAILGFWEIGGWSNFYDKIIAAKPEHFDIFLPLSNENYPWLGMVLGLAIVLSPAWWCCHQAIIQRSLGAKTEWDAKAGMIFAAIPKLFIPLLVVLPGFFAIVFCTNPAEIQNPDQALPWVIKHLLPPGLAGLVFVSFIAALHSSADSTLNSAATIWTRDIYAKFFKKNASDAHYLKAGKVMTIVFVVWGVMFAPVTDKFPGIYLAMQNILSFFQGGILATVLLGILWKRATGMGGLAGLIGGVCISGILFYMDINFLYVAWWSFTGSLLLNFIVSLFTKPEPAEKIRDLVYGDL